MDMSMFNIAIVGLHPNSANFGRRATWESPQLAKRTFSTLGLLRFFLNKYTSRLVNYYC
jgi:hypothetical protein